MINKTKLWMASCAVRPVKVQTVPQTILFNGKRYEKPASLNRKTWDSLIDYLNEHDDADFDVMLTNALGESDFL